MLRQFQQGESTTNRLVGALSVQARRTLWPLLERFTIAPGEVLFDVGTPVTHLYFIERGLVSLVKRMEDGKALEVGAVGIEGISTPNAIFGVDRAIVESVVQIPGAVLRIRKEDFKEMLDDDADFRRVVQGYISAALNQVAQTAACNALHSLEERCSRWLLIGHDNALSDSFPLTHDALAQALGVRRASVSVTESALQKAGLIDYTRGNVRIIDRPGLQSVACECYPTIVGQFDELFLRRGRGAV
jgi:CRP-like cAMP-binding protein